MSEPTADELARWAEEHRCEPLNKWHPDWCAECDVEWPCLTARLLALVAAQAEQIAVVQSRLLSAELDVGLVIEASRDRAEVAEAKLARVRAACDEADRRGLGTDHIRAALDGTEGAA